MSVFDHFVGLALKRLRTKISLETNICDFPFGI